MAKIFSPPYFTPLEVLVEPLDLDLGRLGEALAVDAWGGCFGDG